ncbi:MAG: methylenetetrahydrofolate reductase (NADPH) [Alphaproteobacteria bacterium]|jgi:methylenetetrahydrofolate reductase (NADPH)
MKVAEHIDKATRPLFSFEIVPPPRGRSIQDIVDVVEILAPYNPPWIDVTSHPSGAFYNEQVDGTVKRRIYKKRPGTIGICGVIQNRFKIDTVTHLLCSGFSKEETEDALIELNYLGIHNVFALKGDGPNYNKKIAASRTINEYAGDLVGQINDMKQGNFLDDLAGCSSLDFCVGVAGYPEKHFEAPNLSNDIVHLKNKIDAGADYITTQMFYDNKHYFSFVEQCRAAGILVPIIPGLKIIRSVKQLQSVPRNFYVNFPEDFVNEVLENPKHVVELGIAHAAKQSEELLSAGLPGVHFYVMNDAESVAKVIGRFV